MSSTLQKLVRMSSASCSGNVPTLVISVLVESSRELSLAWENKDFLELTFPGVISRSSPPISMTCFFPLILSGVMIFGSSLLLRFSQLTSSVAEIASSTKPHFLFYGYTVCRPVPIDLDFWLLTAPLCHNILLKSNRGFPPAMSAKISFKMTLSFPQPQSLCHRIYNSCFDYLP